MAKEATLSLAESAGINLELSTVRRRFLSCLFHFSSRNIEMLEADSSGEFHRRFLFFINKDSTRDFPLDPKAQLNVCLEV